MLCGFVLISTGLTAIGIRRRAERRKLKQTA